MKLHYKNIIQKTEFKLTIKARPKYRIRLWMAKRLVKLAARILGCKAEVHDEGKTN